MKVLVAISCLLAVASAGILNPALRTVALQPQHVPIIGPNGVPLEPAENVAARAVHAAAHIEANARNGQLGLATPLVLSQVAPLALARATPLAIAPGPIYAGPQHLPVIGPNGVPLEPAENVARRNLHQAAHVEAAIRNGDHAIVAPIAHGVPLAIAQTAGLAINPIALAARHHVPVIGPNGVPLEPAANVAARALHAATHIEAKARNGDLILGRYRRGIVGAGYAAPLALAHSPIYTGPQHIPVIGPNGVPLEPAENVAARAIHANAHAEANARNHGIGLIASSVLSPIGAPIALSAGIHPANTYPALNIVGQPLETPEVVAAKSAHFAAHAEANARNHGAALIGAPLALSAPGLTAISVNGLPIETHEVAAARAAHLNAHINAKIAHGLL